MNRDLQKKNQELAAYDHTIAHSLKEVRFKGEFDTYLILSSGNFEFKDNGE